MNETRTDRLAELKRRLSQRIKSLTKKKKSDFMECPNPNCRSKSLRLFEGEGSMGSYVYCLDCRMQGPEGMIPKKAVRLWNNLPRKR